MLMRSSHLEVVAPARRSRVFVHAVAHQEAAKLGRCETKEFCRQVQVSRHAVERGSEELPFELSENVFSNSHVHLPSTREADGTTRLRLEH